MSNRNYERCFHFNGIQHDECDAGVNYRELDGNPDPGMVKRIPCTHLHDGNPVKCDLYRKYTQEEIAASERELSEALGFGSFTCPKCRSHFFSSGSWSGKNTGYCKGHWNPEYREYSNCDFTWDRDKEDVCVGLTKPDKAPVFHVKDHVGTFTDQEGKPLFEPQKD